MKRFKHIVLAITFTASVILALIIAPEGCSKYDTSIRKELDDLKTIVEKLDDWSKKANSQITALEGLVSALEKNDYIEDVIPIMEGSKEVGYSIIFSNRNPITILNGEDGKDGIIPQIGVKKEDDGKHYWTIQIGIATPKFILNAEGQKIPVTGEDGATGATGTTPTINVATYDGANVDFKGKLCWKINGVFLLDGDNPVIATGIDGSQGPEGPQGDAIFKKDGISIDRDNGTVTFTLADGISTIVLPLVNKLSISILGGNSIIEISQSTHQITINGKGSYTAIRAEITSGAGVVSDVVITKSSITPAPWSVKLGTKISGSDNTWSSIVTINRYIVPASQYLTSNEAILKITVIDARGNEISTSCPLRILTVAIGSGKSLETEINALAPLAMADIKFLKIDGLISSTDFTGYLRSNFKGTVLDISDAAVQYDKIPNNAFYDGSTANTTLQSVIFPKNVSIESYAFAKCTALTSVDMTAITAIKDDAFSETALTSVSLPIATTIGNYTFFSCKALSTIDMPKVTTIGYSAFLNCISLASVNMPVLEKIPGSDSFYGVFGGCASLINIDLPKTTEIGAEAFDACTSLSSINMPKVTSIKIAAFHGCTSLTKIIFYSLNNTSNLAQKAFLNSSITDIKIYNSTASFISTLNTWLDIYYPAATAIAGT